MCAAAIHWAKIDAVIYGATITDAQNAGFNELACSCRSLYASGNSPVGIHDNVLSDRCKNLFALWRDGPDPNPY